MSDKTITVDAGSFESADDDTTATTYYGGYVIIYPEDACSQEVKCSGTDRDSFNCFDLVVDTIAKSLGIELEADAFQKLSDEIMDKMSDRAVFEVSTNSGKLFVNKEEVCL